jgi:hypothetical protein
VRRLKKLSLAAVGIIGSSACLAGPFCVIVSGMGAECRYFDEASCATAASAAHGACIVNRREVTATSSMPRNAHFCLVSAGAGPQCLYYDVASRQRAASDNGGTCVAKHH